jgi:hypothetical protein
MDKNLLVNQVIIEGKRLIEALDSRDFKVNSAFWYYSSEINEWTLFISTPLAITLGPIKGYEIIRSVIKEIMLSQISINDISIVDPNFWLVKVLTSAIKTGKGIVNLKFSNSLINGVLIEDAHIYRSN